MRPGKGREAIGLCVLACCTVAIMDHAEKHEPFWAWSLIGVGIACCVLALVLILWRE